MSEVCRQCFSQAKFLTGEEQSKAGGKKKEGCGRDSWAACPKWGRLYPIAMGIPSGGVQGGTCSGNSPAAGWEEQPVLGGGVCTPSLLLAARIRPPPRNGRCSPSAIYHHLRASEVCREQLLRSAERRGGTGRLGGGKGAGGCPVCAPSLGLCGRWGGIRRGYWGRGIDGVIWRRGALMGCVGKGMW